MGISVKRMAEHILLYARIDPSVIIGWQSGVGHSRAQQAS